MPEPEAKTSAADEFVVRVAEAGDMASVASIINHYITTTAYNFRTAAQTADEWVADWRASRGRYPWLVASDAKGAVLGVAYAGVWNTRAAYDWSAQVTVYVDAAARRRGIGRALYGVLIPLLDRLGFHAQLGLIALPNPGSVALHEAFGFRSVGVLREVGHKHGAWRDVGIWQRTADRPGETPPPTAPPPERL
ncbi:MAG: N-acetyltransferase family protein [Bauldia sp.]